MPISAIIFGGRRAHLAPLVYEAFDWEHGVFVGATMASERTAAQFGKLGEVRRDPMAMLPFCGYHMGDYFEHWLNMGTRMANPPKIFHVNWFRTDENGKFLWPGYGENLRVIEWILDRCRGEADAVKTPIGYVPTPDSLDLTGLDISREALAKLFAVNRTDWYQETDNVATFFQQFGKRLPRVLWEQLEQLRQRLRSPLSLLKPGAEIRPLAAELNDVIERENPHVYAMLSEFGKRLYFPKGILAQSAEAKDKAKRYDATIGIARENGKPMFLPSVMRYFNDLTPGRGADLRAGHRPARSAQEMARGTAAEEPQPGGQEVLHAHRHRRRDPRPEPGGRPVRRQGRHGAAARQVLGELRTAVRRALPGAVGASIRSSTPRAGSTSRPSARRWPPAREAGRRSSSSTSPTTPPATPPRRPRSTRSSACSARRPKTAAT